MVCGMIDSFLVWQCTRLVVSDTFMISFAVQGMRTTSSRGRIGFPISVMTWRVMGSEDRLSSGLRGKGIGVLESLLGFGCGSTRADCDEQE